jgi:hypothetical protein
MSDEKQEGSRGCLWPLFLIPILVGICITIQQMLLQRTLRSNLEIQERLRQQQQQQQRIKPSFP